MLKILLDIIIGFVISGAIFSFGLFIGYIFSKPLVEFQINPSRINKMFKILHLKECKFCEDNDVCRETDHSKCNKFYKHFDISERHFREIVNCFIKRRKV